MSLLTSHYALWRQGCPERLRNMSNTDLLLKLAEYSFHRYNDCGGMYEFGHMIAQMKERGWNVDTLFTDKKEYNAYPCILKNNTLTRLDHTQGHKQNKKDILKNTEDERTLASPKKRGVMSWLQNHLKRNNVPKKNINIPTTIPSFSFFCSTHGTIGRYEKLRKYDVYLINHSDITYNHILLGNDICCGEDDLHIGPLAPNSLYHVQTSTREDLRYPNFLDVYEYRGALPITFIADIPEETLYTRNKKFIKALNQEGWEIEINLMEEKS